MLLQTQYYQSSRLTFQHALDVARGGSIASCGLAREVVANDSFHDIEPVDFHVTNLQSVIVAKSPCAIYDLINGDSDDDTFTLIRLSPKETRADNFAVEVVLLYNCAMARESYARVLESHDRPIAATVQHQCAARLLERADELLDQLCVSSLSLDNKPADHDHDLRSIRFLHLLILLSLYDLKASQTEAAKTLREKLFIINSNLETLCGVSGQQANHSSSVRRARAA